jgi:hypothetical protein
VFRSLADAVLVLHLLFIAFVTGGATLVLRWPKVAWAHVPAVLWGVTIELTGGTCPLTPLENLLLERAGGRTYSGDFIAHYLESWIYPSRLPPSTQVALAVLVTVVNVVLYALVFTRRRRRR